MMITKTFPIAERLVANGLDLIRQLQQLLVDEAVLLKKGDQIVPLNDLIQKKQPIINEINQFCRQIGQVLTTETLPNNQNGMLQYLEKAKATGLNTDGMRQNWTDIVKIAHACKTMNEKNGGSIDILRRYIQRSLNILKGNLNTPHTYDRDGSAKSELLTRKHITV